MKYPALSIAIILMLAGMIISCADNHKQILSSPDKQLSITFTQSKEGAILYTFTAGGDTLINLSPLGFRTESGACLLTENWKIEEAGLRTMDDVWEPVWGKRKTVRDHFQELTLTLTVQNPTASDELSSSLSKIQLIARAYNDGVAFRYVLPTDQKNIHITEELTGFHFAGDYTAWFYNGENHNIGPEKLTDYDGIFRPVMTVKTGDHYMAIHEAELIDGVPLALTTKKGETCFSVAPKEETLYSGYASAWRVILCGTTPGRLVDSHLIELLNPQPDDTIDFSWVKPGIAVWDWRINGAITEDGFTYTMSFPSWVRMIDFAAEQGFSYLVLDADWYGPEHESESNPISGDKSEDVKRIIRYGKEKGVGVWLYLNDVGGRKYPIEKTLKQYGEWGAAGVKYGFMSGTPQEKNKWTQQITRLCAENKLLVDYHDNPVHPYGQMRTWPNAVTREFCHAQLDGHHVFYPKTFVTSVFVNMIAGPLDMNNGMFELRQGHTTRVDENQPVPSTLVAEAARTLIVFSGATILPDIPEYYHKYPDLLAFISAQQMPWLESITLDGEIGEYIVMARQTNDGWLVAAATNETGRTIEVPLDFLDDGVFEATITEDGDDAHYLTNRESLKTTRKTVKPDDRIQLKLAPGGGACVRLQKEKRHIHKRGSLQNSKIKFEQKKKGRVAFLGGSITEMTGWRDMICEELQRRFPETEFDFINAGISSTGTTPGAFRFKRDVLCNGPVDLLFEEAAVNDETNHFNDTEQIRGMEGIVRQALLANANTDIIILHFIWDEMLQPLKQGTIPQVIVNHEKVAEYYQIPSINLALEVSQRMQAGEFDWNTFGGTHPAPFGHQIYAATICRLFDDMWGTLNDQNTPNHAKTSSNDPSSDFDFTLSANSSRNEMKAHHIPETPLDIFSYFNGKLADVRDVKLADVDDTEFTDAQDAEFADAQETKSVDIRDIQLGDGWKFEADWQPSLKAGTRKGFVHVPAIETLTAEAELRFSFNGKAIGIFHAAGPDAGILEYSIDSKPFKQKDLFTEWSAQLYIPWVTMLEQELDEVPHEIVIRMAKEHNPDSKGTACRIFHFTVNE